MKTEQKEPVVDFLRGNKNMKIVVFPGVGFHTNLTEYSGFIDKIKTGCDCDVTMFNWKHDWPIPDTKLPIVSVRKWICEVLLDFQQVIRHAIEMEVPEADFYIGHSAGSVIALVQKNPCIIFGSPATLVEIAQFGEMVPRTELMKAMNNDGRKVYNIINKSDQLAYGLSWPSVENYTYSNSAYCPCTYNPLAAHSDYWDNSRVTQKIVDKINEWKKW